MVSVETVAKMRRDLNIAKTTGFDDMSARFLRNAANLIAPFIMTHIMYLCLEQGTAPSDMKHSKVILLYKKGLM